MNIPRLVNNIMPRAKHLGAPLQVREERYRCERLEEQLNDMTELHQHEVANISSGVRDMEEKVSGATVMRAGGHVG